jgi:hypothetical protein
MPEGTGGHFLVPLFFLAASEKALTGRKQVLTVFFMSIDLEPVCVYTSSKVNSDIITLKAKCLTVTAQEQHISFSG